MPTETTADNAGENALNSAASPADILPRDAEKALAASDAEADAQDAVCSIEPEDATHV